MTRFEVQSSGFKVHSSETQIQNLTPAQFIPFVSSAAIPGASRNPATPERQRGATVRHGGPVRTPVKTALETWRQIHRHETGGGFDPRVTSRVMPATQPETRTPRPVQQTTAAMPEWRAYLAVISGAGSW
jgi:hypothetical protein